jgi:Domain of unknown function (DUF1735)/Family of unknown function (DUF5627)
MMKRIFILIIFIIGIAACENQPISFPDYDYNAVYFPYQLPVRTLSLGEDRIDNSLDKEFKFDIGVSIGGMYKNTRDWSVDFVVDNTLTAGVYTMTSPQLYTEDQKIEPLPEGYYTLNPVGTVTIPKGDFNGMIRVQLTDLFFNDTLSITGRYVIPLKITDTTADSVLSGQAAISNPDPRIVGNWVSNKSPKYWVMFGINYVNPYHGTWLHRGRDIRVDNSTSEDDTIIFRTKYIEKGALIKLSTTGRKKVITNGIGNQIGADYSMVIEFANDKGTPGAITINPRPGFPYAVTGSGQYYDIANSNEQWTGLTWQSMYLSYTYDDGTYTHQINDTLVFRDRGIKFTQNSIVVQP